MANNFYLRVTGQKQGELKGEKGKIDKGIPILGFSYAVQSPVEAGSGQATGKRQHKPVTVFKEWGGISPQLFEALVNHELLTSVVIDQVRSNPAGKEEVWMEIRLSNARLMEVSINPERSEENPLWTAREIEQVSFVFEKIEIENKASKVTAIDDWHSSNK
jgi:type VI secretion system secreted protein Hcp